MRRRMTTRECLFLAALALAATAGIASADTVTLKIPGSEAAPGAKVTVSVCVERPQGLGALQFVVAYDPKALDAPEADAGEVFVGLADSNVLTPGRL